MFKIPSKIKIGGYTYEVIVEKREVNHGTNSFGSANTRYLRILIEEDLPQQQKESTLIHEIIEMIDSNFDLQLSHQTISTISDSLYQVLVDNY